MNAAGPKPRPRFPWLALILFLASLFVFWVLPYQLGTPPLQVEFVNSP